MNDKPGEVLNRETEFATHGMTGNGCHLCRRTTRFSWNERWIDDFEFGIRLEMFKRLVTWVPGSTAPTKCEPLSVCSFVSLWRLFISDPERATRSNASRCDVL
jgi:hypothetical protein